MWLEMRFNCLLDAGASHGRVHGVRNLRWLSLVSRGGEESSLCLAWQAQRSAAQHSTAGRIRVSHRSSTAPSKAGTAQRSPAQRSTPRWRCNCPGRWWARLQGRQGQLSTHVNTRQSRTRDGHQRTAAASQQSQQPLGNGCEKTGRANPPRNSTRGLVTSAMPMLTRLACPPLMPRAIGLRGSDSRANEGECCVFCNATKQACPLLTLPTAAAARSMRAHPMLQACSHTPQCSPRLNCRFHSCCLQEHRT